MLSETSLSSSSSSSEAGIGRDPYAIVVVGGGPVGSAAALGLGKLVAGTSHRVALVAAAPPQAGTGAEARTAALFGPALDYLDWIGALDGVKPASAPMAGLRILDRTEALLRAPEVLFEASEIDQPWFGLNVPNSALAASLRTALDAAAASASSLVRYEPATVTAVEPTEDHVELTLSTGQRLSAALVIAADGRHSICRAAARITADLRPTGQVAITANLEHTRPHYGISTEIHRASGPLTTVPLPSMPEQPHRSALVWMERPAVAERLLALDDEAFRASLSHQLDGLLGDVVAITPRSRFDLTYGRTAALGAKRILLVGETAHTIPPIGAQGLNLSLADVSAMIEAVSTALAAGRDPGGADVLAAYSAARMTDIAMRTGAVETLNGSLLMDFAPVHLARGAGLHVVRAIGPLRRELMRRGLGVGATKPAFMRTSA
jgi:2-octaprenyl-6-methoxyphenol hydroxylase